MSYREAVRTGRIGEFFAAAIIEQMGWQTAMCQQSGVDMILWKNDHYFRAQVKASHVHKDREKLQFHFGLGGKKRRPVDEFDLACCVSIPHRKAFFMPISDIHQVTLSKPVYFFDDPEIENYSFNYTMETLLS